MNSLYRYEEPPLSEVSVAKAAQADKGKAEAASSDEDDDEMNDE